MVYCVYIFSGSYRYRMFITKMIVILSISLHSVLFCITLSFSLVFGSVTVFHILTCLRSLKMVLLN